MLIIFTHCLYQEIKNKAYSPTFFSHDSNTGCIGGIFKIFKPLWYLGFRKGQLPYLDWFSKAEFINQVRDCGFIIEKEWGPTKVDIFLIAKKK